MIANNDTMTKQMHLARSKIKPKLHGDHKQQKLLFLRPFRLERQNLGVFYIFRSNIYLFINRLNQFKLCELERMLIDFSIFQHLDNIIFSSFTLKDSNTESLFFKKFDTRGGKNSMNSLEQRLCFLGTIKSWLKNQDHYDLDNLSSIRP